jgi:hypothetical protein
MFRFGVKVTLTNNHSQLLLTEPSMDRSLKKFFGYSLKYEPFFDTMIRVIQQNHLTEGLLFWSSSEFFLFLLFAHNH